MSNNKKVNKFMARIEELKKEHKLDLSADEDLSIAVMNLISLEEHFYFTAAKTGHDKYYDFLQQIREIRKQLLKKIIKKSPEGEIWCISKHLLATSMRLIEVGTKYQAQNKKEEAEDFFRKAYTLYSLFWGINLKLIDIGEIKKKTDKTDLNKQLNDLVQELIDCCEE